MSNRVRLHDDDRKAIAIRFSRLEAHPETSTAESIRTLKKSDYFMRPGCFLSFDFLDVLTEMYLIADKYDMPALRNTIASQLLPEHLKAPPLAARSGHPYFCQGYFCRRYKYTAYCRQSSFLRAFFDKIIDKLGDFPEELFEAFYLGVKQYANLDGDVQALMNAAAEYPDLLVYTSIQLAKTYYSARTEALRSSDGKQPVLGELKLSTEPESAKVEPCREESRKAPYPVEDRIYATLEE